MLKKTHTVINTLTVLLVSFCTVIAQTSSSDLAQRFHWPGNSQAVVHAVIAGLFAALAILAIASVFQKKQKERGIKEFLNLQFTRRAKTVGLNVAEQTLLKSIAWAVAPKMFSDVFNSLMIFENAVELEMSRLIKTYGEDGKKTNEVAISIFIIRKKLGFDIIIPEKALESSRNIEFGQAISILSSEEKKLIGKTKVLNNNELYFEADLLGLDSSFSSDKDQSSVIVNFSRHQDASYSVHLTIRSVNLKDNVISFYHTTVLERNQVRKYARISIDIPIQCRIIKRVSEDAVPNAGEILEKTFLQDISGGGLAFTSTIPLSPDDIAMFSFSLQNQKMVMKGKIVTVSAQEGKHNVYYRHGVVFYNAKQSDVERIVRFIYEKQREKILLG